MHPTIPLPDTIVELVDELMTGSGALAVVLGGSRALGTVDDSSDWDLGVYYRGAIDLKRLAARGVVYPPGSWGRLMNGGAWLRCDGLKVDVLLRNLDAVEHWTRRAEEGEFEIDALLGYVAGVPTYLLSAELASCQVLRGELASAPFPTRLIAAAPSKWRFCRSFSLEYARMHARRNNVAGMVGQAAKAVMEEAHAIMCERGRWVCNEKQLIESADLGAVQAVFGDVPVERARLLQWVDRVADQLGVLEDETAPWNHAARGPDSRCT
ncbi:MAG TPA: nucleotidyltransferase domain-containing protein [Vicinamibacterales bacterium]|jgi:hypothetical protein